MSDNNQTPLQDHDYDGIQELDNALPSWWLYGFLLTIIFGSIYWLHYTISDAAPTQLDELKSDMSIIQAKQKVAESKPETQEDLEKLLHSNTALKRGAQVFSEKCAPCHGPQLQGLIGPNLTDDYWIHGKGKLTDIINVVREGVLDKGMPSWKAQLAREDIESVVVFVKSQHGIAGPNPKPPQGDRVEN